MTIIGFIFLFIISLLGTGFWISTWGVTTKWYWKIVTLLLGIAVYYNWILLFEHAPFAISVAN